MATVAGGDHNTASSNTATTTWYECHLLSFGADAKDFCLLSERNQRAEVPPKQKKFGKMLSFSQSSSDLRHSVTDKNRRDGSSPTGVIEACLNDFESGSGSAEPADKEPEVENSNVRAHSNWNNIIGKGGFAEVYKGRLQNGKLVAIKRLSKGTADEKTTVFLSELGIMAHVDHPNTAKLLGCGIEGGMHLVFELSPLGSLGSVLHGTKGVELDWSKRYKIALGSAEGLLYLHENCRKRIIHRDIKADNILLTEDFEPQICDFGLAKWLPRQWTHRNVSKFEGTFGYFAPEYFMHGIVDEKTDTYAMGVLLLELITGRPALDHLQQSLVIWAKPLLDNNDIKELADPSLGDHYDIEEMERVILTASLCIEQSPILRPRMNQVVILLRGDEYVRECAKENQRKTLQRTYSEELLDAQEYNSTKYLNDLKRHKELALGC
ncbi:ATP binding protein, putative [Ricinus communis]|uniref:non-specific serine/threonine protein kinase n=1 Tax=Ricinus communis TaxID=3988 RepID=B9REZ8_RICCO|nr:ATP binding protein, putative [Ricinus communis]